MSDTKDDSTDCLNCGNGFRPIDGDDIYCSERCVSEYIQKNWDEMFGMVMKIREGI